MGAPEILHRGRRPCANHDLSSRDGRVKDLQVRFGCAANDEGAPGFERPLQAPTRPEREHAGMQWLLGPWVRARGLVGDAHESKATRFCARVRGRAGFTAVSLERCRRPITVLPSAAGATWSRPRSRTEAW